MSNKKVRLSSLVHPFADFLENEESYLAAQQVWQDLIRQVALVHG